MIPLWRGSLLVCHRLDRVPPRFGQLFLEIEILEVETPTFLIASPLTLVITPDEQSQKGYCGNEEFEDQLEHNFPFLLYVLDKEKQTKEAY